MSRANRLPSGRSYTQIWETGNEDENVLFREFSY